VWDVKQAEGPRCVFAGMALVSKGVEEGGPRPTEVGEGLQDAPLAHRRPGYPLIGLLASRARLRLARQGEDSASRRRNKEANGR
jgi:hypothetical protein